jgi:hypothetical protein
MTKGDKMSIIVPPTVSDNILMNKHDIKEQYQHQQIDSIPIVDSENPKYIEEITGNQLRVLKDYPAGYDFCLNIIDLAKKAEKKTKKIIITEYSQDYYKIDVTGAKFSQYFAECGNNDIRHNLSVQLRKDFTHGIVTISGEDKRGKYIATKVPFRINEVKQYIADDSVYIQLLLLKDVFGSLIEGRCLKNGGEGFVKMPAVLFPACTKTNKYNMSSYNPIYRLQTYGLSKNTNKQKWILVSRRDFLTKVAPEYIDKNDRSAWLKDMTIKDFHKSLRSQSLSLIDRFPNETLIQNFHLGYHNEPTVIYFRTI